MPQFLLRFSPWLGGMLALLLVACTTGHAPMSREDRQIVAVMTVIGAGIGAGIGAASTSGSDTAGVAVGGALAGAFSGYALGNIIVEHMNQQEKAIRLSAGVRNGDIYVERVRPDRLKLSLEHGAEFARGSAELSKRGKADLSAVAEAIARHGPVDVSIVAYANDAPGAAENARLSAQRAHAVADYLRQHGLDAPSLRSEGKGRPVILPAGEKAQKNPYFRRVEIIVQARAG